MKEEMILDPEKNTLISDEYLSQVLFRCAWVFS